jgi:hypothetical protein
MVISILAARIDTRWQFGEQLFIEAAPNEFPIERLRIDADENRFEPQINESMGEFDRVFAPSRKDRTHIDLS